MITTIALNALLAIAVLGGILVLLTRSIRSAQIETPAQPERSRKRRSPAARAATVTG